MKTALKQTVYRGDIHFNVNELPLLKDSKRQERGDDQSERQFSIGTQQKMPSYFHKLLELSCFRKKLLRFFIAEIEHPEYALIIKSLYCAINNDWKKLYCRNGILKNERVPELYGNHLEGDTQVVFYAKNADRIDTGNIVVRANDTDIAVILIWNIHHMDSDVSYDSGYNYDSSRECINIKKLVRNVQNVSSLPGLHAFLGNDYTPFLERGKLNLCR